MIGYADVYSRGRYFALAAASSTLIGASLVYTGPSPIGFPCLPAIPTRGVLADDDFGVGSRSFPANAFAAAGMRLPALPFWD
jgi:hypothetical protein